MSYNTRAINEAKIDYDVKTPNSGFTVEFWIKLDFIPTAIITNIFRSSIGSTNTNGAPSSTSTAEIAINQNGVIGMRAASNCYGGGGNLVYGSIPLNAGGTYHVAVCGDTRSAEIYIDGELSLSRGSVVRCSSTFGALYLNKDSGINIEFPRFWSRKLTQDEIRESVQKKSKIIDNREGLIMYDLFNNNTSLNEVTKVKNSKNFIIGYPSIHSILIENFFLIREDGVYKKYDGDNWVNVSGDFQVNGMDLKTKLSANRKRYNIKVTNNESMLLVPIDLKNKRGIHSITVN